MGRKKGRAINACIKDTWTKPNVGWDQGWEVGMTGVAGSGGGKMETAVLKQQLKKRYLKK